MTIDSIQEWFEKAVPNPDNKNFNTQLGCDLEELVEMLDALKGVNEKDTYVLNNFKMAIQGVSDLLKTGSIQLMMNDRLGFLDAICDRIVTTVGIGVFEKLPVGDALKEVNHSNWTKFDEQGNPIFDENQKIKKGPKYVRPDLRQFIAHEEE